MVVIDGRPDCNSLRILELRALARARRELGYGEADANNCGPDVERYTCGKAGGAWCAAFVCYCYEQAAASLSMPMPFSRTHGARKLLRHVEAIGSRREVPAGGMIICWRRGTLSWQGHVGIVDHYHAASDTLVTIEGNVGKFPALVKTRTYNDGAWRKRLIGIASIVPLS